MDTLLRENINWVGYVDWTVRDFHGYDTARGATYNAYLVQDDKTALIDTVKAPYAGELLKHVSALTSLDEVDYIVCNHAEPDHAGALPAAMAAMPNATLVCDRKCLEALGEHFDITGWKTQIVKTGDSISLGRRTLQFIETPMVHWPESMFTYIPEEKLLFSMDAFGQHFASSQRFDDEVNLSEVMYEAKAYYANIVMPYGNRVTATLKQAAELEIDMIATSHGVIWRSHVAGIVKAYADWAVCKPVPKVLVIYDTMWDATGKMARAIHEGACVDGVQAELIYIRTSNITKIATEVMDAAAVAFGSSTLNSTMLPMAGATLIYLHGLKPVGKHAFAFGSYGWGKGGAGAVDEWLKAMKWDIVREPIRARYSPDEATLETCREAGRELARIALDSAADHQG